MSRERAVSSFRQSETTAGTRPVVSPRLRRAGVEALLAAGGCVPVAGECMDPAVPEGASVRLETCGASGLLPGDVVLSERGDASGGGLVLHRYLATIRVGPKRHVLLKSDASRRPDPPLPAGNVLGRLVGMNTAEVFRPYRPGFRERLTAACLGFFWADIAPFLREARDALWNRKRRRRS